MQGLILKALYLTFIDHTMYDKVTVETKCVSTD